MSMSLTEAKSFEISKREVWQAYERVKANKGAPGVDGVSLQVFGNVNLSWPHRDGVDWPQLSCFRGVGLLGQPQKMQVGSRSSSRSRSSTRFDGASGS